MSDMGDPSQPSQEQATKATVVPSDTTTTDMSPAGSIYKGNDFKASRMVKLAMTTLAVLTLIIALDGTCLAVALPVMADELGGTGLQAFWAGTSFLLCSSVFQPPLGALSSVFGRKPVLAASVAVFLAATVVCSVACDFNVVLVGRSLQGFGGGGIIVLTEIIVCDLIPLRQRGQWFGVVSAMYSVGTVLGPVIGGALANHVTWRWIFWVNLPFLVAGLVMTPLFIRLQVAPSSLASKLARVDWVGNFIFIGSSTSFLLGISWGGVQYAWSSVESLAPILLGIAGFFAFCFWEEYGAHEPIVRLSVFRNRNVAAAYVGTIILNMIVYTVLFYMPLYYQGVKGYSATITGIAVFPQTFTVAPAALVVGVLIGKLGTYRWALWQGWAVTCLGLGLLVLLDAHSSVPQWLFLNLVSGLGTGILYPAMQFAVQAASSDADLAVAVALFSFFRALGQAVGVAVGGTIFQNRLHAALAARPDVAPDALALSKDAAALARTISDMPVGAARTELVDAYAEALKVVWVVLCVLAGVGLLLGFAIRDYPLDRFLVSPQHPEMPKKADEEKIDVGDAARGDEVKVARQG